MSVTTLQVSIRVNGTLTDPDGNAVTVGNVVRTDTGAVVLSGPASMTRTGAGVYQYPLPDPANGIALTYTWNASFSRNGVPQSPQLSTRQTQTIDTPAGRYATLADWDNFAGTLNVLAYSDKDGAGTLNAAGVQAAMDYADAEVDLALDGKYLTPLVFNAGVVHPTVKYWATVIGVGRYEYFGRGQSETDKAGDKFKRLVDAVYREMEMALWPPFYPMQLKPSVSYSVDVQERTRNPIVCLPLQIDIF